MIYAEAAGIERQEAATTAYKVYDGHVLRFSSENLDDAMNEAFKLVRKNKDDSTTFVYLWENNRPDCSGYYYFNADYFIRKKCGLLTNSKLFYLLEKKRQE